jgi:predicted Zn-dependent protease
MTIRRVALLTALSLAALAGACQSKGSRAPHMIAASGDRAIAKGDFALAEQEYAQVVAAQPWNARARLQYGKALLGVNKPREAREELERAYTVMPKDDETMLTLGEAMGRSGDYEGGARLLQSIAEERRRPADWLRLGRYAQRGKDFDTAEKAYLAAALGDGGLHVEPQMALYHYYVEVGNDQYALDRLAMAYWLEPGNKMIQEKIREHGVQPSADFAMRPVEQTPNRIPDPTIPRK